jgi:hypothetical protein
MYGSFEYFLDLDQSQTVPLVPSDEIQQGVEDISRGELLGDGLGAQTDDEE